MKRITYLAGLPRSGSTLLSNLLAMHSDVQATPSSPLCEIVQNMRKQWSDNTFLLSQLDDNFPVVHERLKRSMWAFMQAWSSDNTNPVVIDKNRGWLFALEWLRELDPDFKMIIALRDIRDVYASIEKKHRKTLFIDFPDHMEHNIVDQRANALFADGGIIGSILKAIQNMYDIPDIMSHIYYWRFEDFLNRPTEVMHNLFEFINLEPIDIAFDNIVQSTHESDSFYRMKYEHKIYNSIRKPMTHKEIPISPRIIKEIENRFQWYFEQFYSDYKEKELVQGHNADPINSTSNSHIANENDGHNNDDTTTMIADLERAIQQETN
ncbi:MAG: sulfotransferase family protein [bacterium]